MNNFAIWFILIAILILAVVGILYLAFARATPKLNVTRFRTQWLAIENSFSKSNPASWHVAIFNADKLVDKALRESRYKGETMGERMKSAQNAWSHPNHIWGAHKIRNRLAHDTEVKLSHDLALRALSAYKQALKDLGAI